MIFLSACGCEYALDGYLPVNRSASKKRCSANNSQLSGGDSFYLKIST